MRIKQGNPDAVAAAKLALANIRANVQAEEDRERREREAEYADVCAARLAWRQAQDAARAMHGAMTPREMRDLLAAPRAAHAEAERVYLKAGAARRAAAEAFEKAGLERIYGPRPELDERAFIEGKGQELAAMRAKAAALAARQGREPK